jgi:tRNA splicing ligase
MAQLDLSQIKTRVNAGLIRIRDTPSFSGINVCCYTEKVQYEKLWDEYTSMARGLVFNGVNGKILSRPFKKFFNLGEVD